MDKYRKTFFKITESSTTRQIIPSAFISPLWELIISYNAALNLLTGFILAKKVFALPTALSVSSFLKISNKNGLSKAREITENTDDKILKLKYAKTNLGYFEIYLKMDRKLFIYGGGRFLLNNNTGKVTNFTKTNKI